MEDVTDPNPNKKKITLSDLEHWLIKQMITAPNPPQDRNGLIWAMDDNLWHQIHLKMEVNSFGSKLVIDMKHNNQIQVLRSIWVTTF